MNQFDIPEIVSLMAEYGFVIDNEISGHKSLYFHNEKITIMLCFSLFRMTITDNALGVSDSMVFKLKSIDSIKNLLELL